jgi:glycosyltransferase involved in cell wall biosynthesis
MGHRVTFVYGPGAYAAQYASLAANGVDCIEFDLKKNILKSVFFVRKICREKHIELIHSHMHGADLIAALSRIGLKLRHITTIHFLPYKFTDFMFRVRVVTGSFAAYALMERLFTVSAADAEGLSRYMFVSRKKITVLANSIDFSEMNADPAKVLRLKSELKLKPNAVILMCTGNFINNKGQEYLIDALHLLRQKNPLVRLVLLGLGVNENRLRKQAARLKLEDSIVFAGHQKNVPDWLSAADIYIQPSLVDPMPRALLEAMYTGLPVIVSDIDNLREAVKHRVNGIVAPVKSSKAIAFAVEYLLNNKSEAERMGVEARNYVLRNCSMDGMALRICTALGI